MENKINWTQEEISNLNCNNYIICNHCGWLVTNPGKTDENCSNCGKSFEETKTEIKRK